MIATSPTNTATIARTTIAHVMPMGRCVFRLSQCAIGKKRNAANAAAIPKRHDATKSPQEPDGPCSHSNTQDRQKDDTQSTGFFAAQPHL